MHVVFSLCARHGESNSVYSDAGHKLFRIQTENFCVKFYIWHEKHKTKENLNIKN